MTNPVSFRLGRKRGDYAARAQRKTVLQRCLELGPMTSRLRRTLIASLESEHEPDEVDAAVWAFRQSVADLIELRGTHADRVLDEEMQIRAGSSAIQGLLDDLWNSQLEAAE